MTTHVTIRLEVAIGSIERSTYLEGFDLPLFGAHLLSPCRLRFRDRLHARLELVQLFPSRLHLLPHLVGPFGESCLSLFAPFVEIQLDLTEGFETRNQIVMEHAEVREGFSFSLTVLLLIQECIS